VPPGPQPHESAGATFAAFAGDPIDVKVDNEPAQEHRVTALEVAFGGLAIDTITCALTASHLAEVKAELAAVGVGPQDDAYLSPTTQRTARPWNPDSVTHKVADAADAAGVQLDIEGGRHYTASQLLVGGFDLRNTATRFGSQRRRRDHAATLQPT